MSEIDDIQKLSPEERIKKLKELVEKRNKEIQERNKEIEEAEKLAKQAEKDRENDLLQEQISVPETDNVNIDDLFKKDEETLEEKAKSAPEQESDELQEQFQLYNLTPQTPTSDMYTSIRSLYAQAKENGSVMPEMAQQAATITYALDEKLNDENYSPSEDIVAQANMTKKIADKILSLYTAGVKRQNGI